MVFHLQWYNLQFAVFSCAFLRQPTTVPYLIRKFIIGMVLCLQLCSFFSLTPRTFWTESMEWFIEDQAFSSSYGLAPPPPPSPIVRKLDRRHTGRLRKRDNVLMGEGGRGWERSQFLRQRESLVLYKSLNTLWFRAIEPVIPMDNKFYRFYYDWFCCSMFA